MIKTLLQESKKKGVPLRDFPEWLHRRHGVLIIQHPRKDGVTGISIPCVICRKVIEKYGVHWVAYDGQSWVHSKHSENLPVSKPTNRQRRYIF
jgi:hypothetical protein